MYALKTGDGSLLWKYATGNEVDSSPILSADGATLFIGSMDTNIYALKTGFAPSLTPPPTSDLFSATTPTPAPPTSDLPFGLGLGLGIPAVTVAAFLFHKRKTSAGGRAKGSKSAPGVEVNPVDPVAAAADTNAV